METLSILINLILLLFVLLTVYGVLFFIMRTVAKSLATFTFAGFYALEQIIPGYQFRIPQKGIKLYCMEFTAAAVSLFTLLTIYNFYVLINANALSLEVLFPLPLATFVLVLLVIIILISHFTTDDENQGKEWFDKIMLLKFPKKLLK